MRGMQKSKQVTWASDLCQVKLFQSEDCPSKAGIGTRNNLKLKRKRSVAMSEVDFPPGFKGVHPQTQVLKNKLARSLQAKWRCPPTFVLSPTWRVAFGEESKEVKTENQRELRVLEAVYPRPSAILPNPVESMDVGYNFVDDLKTPLVSLTPIEDREVEDPLDSTPFVAPAEVEDPLDYNTQPQQLAAIVTSLSALTTTTNGHEKKLIDHELLMKILTNPSTLKQFIKQNGNPPSQNAPIPLSQPSQITPTQSVPVVNPICNPQNPHFNHLQDTRKPSSTAPTQSVLVNPICSPPIPHFNQLQDSRKPSPPITITMSAAQPTTTTTSNTPSMVKDMDYYKSLIQQHGEEKQQEGLQPQLISYNGSNPNLGPVGKFVQTRESKPKFTKPCSYFNNIKGCRNGAKCTYQHDPSLRKRASGVMELQSAKRMKMERGMRGSQSQILYG